MERRRNEQNLDGYLGMLLDAELSLKQHIDKVAANCFYHLRRLREIRWQAGLEVTTRLVLDFLTPMLDYYCNSVLKGLPQSTIEPLHPGCETSSGSVPSLSLVRQPGIQKK